MIPKNTQFAVVTLGYMRMLMPRAKALKVIELVSDSVLVDTDISDDYRAPILYIVCDPVRVELELVSTDRIVMPEGVASPARRRRPAARAIGSNGPVLLE